MSAETLQCAQAREWIDLAAAGELEAAREGLLATHVMGCAGCAAELGAAERVAAELRALPQLDASPELMARLRAIPRRKARRAAAAARWLVAATLALTAAGWWWREQAPRPEDTTAVTAAEAEMAPSEEEIARATEEARLALALVARYGRKTRDELRDEVLIERVAAPVFESVDRRLRRPTSQGARS